MRALFALVAAVVVCALLVARVEADHVPYRYNISLDDPADRRYYPAVYDTCRDEVHRTALFKLLDDLESQMEKLGVVDYFDSIGELFQQRFPDVYEEVEFVSKEQLCFWSLCPFCFTLCVGVEQWDLQVVR